jgi:serine/threonine protein kinase
MYGRADGPENEAEGEQTMRGVVGGTQLFGRFTLQKVLGRGGMGIVWLAKDDRLDRLVALKLVPESLCFDVSAQEDLKRETRKSLMLTHPNIVRIFDFIEDEHSAGISMEYVDGATLSFLRVQKPNKCFEVDEIAPWVTSLCDALTYAHESVRVIHRDLKPANLMLNSRSELKITDFGIACTLRDSMSYVSVRTSSGTLNYMSPQQLLGEDPSTADDIYALGATIYEMLTSKPPFHGGDIASQVREITAPTIAQRRAKFGISGRPIPKYWEETIADCLAKEVSNRPRLAAEVAQRLRLSGPIRIAARHTSRKFPTVFQLRIAAAIAAVLMIIGAASLLFRRKPHTDSDAAAKAITLPGYGIEAPAKLIHRPAVPAPSTPPGPAGPATPSPTAAPALGKLEMTSTPPSADFAIYPGVIAGKTTPVNEPLRSGNTPGSVENLPPGRYTVFYRKEGWPDDRSEISLEPGETLPIAYTFPHGSVSITSTPDGAEIFFGTTSLGTTPLMIDLPPGKQKLTARLENFSERSQTVTVETGGTANLAFQMRGGSSARSRSSRRKATPPPFFDRMGETLKHVFSGAKPTPTPRKRRH